MHVTKSEILNLDYAQDLAVLIVNCCFLKHGDKVCENGNDL